MRVMVVAVVVFALVGVALNFVPLGEGDASQEEKAAVSLDQYGSVQAFSFIDESGQGFSSETLNGKVWLANFVFTSCAAECPILSQRVAEVRQNLSGHVDDVAFVSFSVDPQTDTPERLTEFAEPYGREARWKLLTGDPEKLDTLIKKDFLLPLAEGYEERAMIASSGFLHSNKLVVVDGDGVIRYQTDGMEPDSAERVTEAMERLLHH